MSDHRPSYQTAGFRAVLGKELREWRLWGLAALLSTAIWIFAVVWPSLDIEDLYTASILATSVTALALGLAQTLFENRGDRWGFLVHRPPTRTTIFLGKVGAGLLLYLLALLPPFLIAYGVASSPSFTSKPFDVRMLLPLCADLVGGIAIYLAAFTAGIRRGRWYVTRLVPIAGAGMLVAAGVWGSPWFWLAAVAGIVATAAMGVAAWGAFVAGGAYSSQPKASRAVTMTMGAIGYAPVVMLMIVLLVQAVSSIDRPARTMTGSDYAVTDEGSLVKLLWARESIRSVQELDGTPIPQDTTQGRRIRVGDKVRTTGALKLDTARVQPTSTNYRSIRTYFTSSEQVRSLDRRHATNWYFLHREGLLVGYDVVAGSIVGWAGPDGFSPPSERPVRRFTSVRNVGRTFVKAADSTTRAGLLVVTARAAYRLDLVKSTVEVLYGAAGDEVILSGESVLPGPGRNYVALATTRSILIYADRGTALVIPNRANPAVDRFVTVHRTGSGTDEKTFVIYKPMTYGGFPDNHRRVVPITVEEYAAGGELVARHSLEETIERTVVAMSDSVMIAPLSPLLVRAALSFAPDGSLTPYDTPVGSRAPARTTWIVAILAALLYAGIAVARARAFAFSARRTMLWAALGLVLGPLALLMMFTLIEWPARERCPDCNRLRVVTRERCEHCEGEFEPPALDGTEIFDRRLAPA